MSEKDNILIECLDLFEEDFYNWVSPEDFERLRLLSDKNNREELSELESEELEEIDLDILNSTLTAYKLKKQRIQASNLTEEDFYEYGFTAEDFTRLRYLLEKDNPLMFNWESKRELFNLKERLAKLTNQVLANKSV